MMASERKPEIVESARLTSSSETSSRSASAHSSGVKYRPCKRLEAPSPYGFSVTDLRFQSNDPTCNEMLFHCRAIAVFGWKTAEKCGRFTTQVVEVIQKTSP